jgi:hypothetical protein
VGGFKIFLFKKEERPKSCKNCSKFEIYYEALPPGNVRCSKNNYFFNGQK